MKRFAVKPEIVVVESLEDFLTGWGVGSGDLILTNEYVIAPALGGKKPPCDVLYQEEYGTGEPGSQMLNRMLKAAEDKGYTRIIAIGGGTVIDIAKLFLFRNGLPVEEIFRRGASLARERSLVIVPTTCGTGSEMTNISIVDFEAEGTKLGLATPELYADEAVLIPSLLATLPYEVFAASSIDALIHAVESYVSPKAGDFSRLYGEGAIRRILRGYQTLAAGRPGKLPVDMEPFLVASTMAGVAFGNAGCAAVHALSYPVGSAWHIPHGKANYMVFRAVFAAYREKGANLSPLEKLLAQALGCPRGEVWSHLFALLDRVLTRQPLGELGAQDSTCREMAASVVKNQQRLLVNSPLGLTEEDIYGIYKSCL